jgi:hypothetical protein
LIRNPVLSNLDSRLRGNDGSENCKPFVETLHQLVVAKRKSRWRGCRVSEPVKTDGKSS